jgi:hypothetical protein
MKKDFITATPDSGGSGSTTVTATAPANQTGSARSVNLSVAGGGMTRTVGASQAAGVVTWNYYFSVTPTSLSFVAGGESKTVTVTSYRKKVINGVETSTQENVSWSATISGTGFSKNTDGSSITAASNQSGSRSGSVSYTQTTSGKTASVSLNQAGVQYTITYQSSGSFENTYFVFNSNATPTGTPMKYAAMRGVGEEFQEIWSPDPGYRVNDVAKGGARTYLKAGDRVWIRKMTGTGTSWSGSTTQSFILEANNQTVRLN